MLAVPCCLHRPALFCVAGDNKPRGENLGGGLLQPAIWKDSSNYYLFLVFICVDTEALAKVLFKPRETVTN